MAKDMKDQLQALRLSLRPADKLSDRDEAEVVPVVAPPSDINESRIKQLESEAHMLRKTILELEIANSTLDEARSLATSKLALIAQESGDKSKQISELDQLLVYANARLDELGSELLDSQAAINNLLDKSTSLTDENTTLSKIRDHLQIRVAENDQALERYSQLAPRLDELNSVLSKSNELEAKNASLARLCAKQERKVSEMATELDLAQRKLDRVTVQKRESKQQLKDVSAERDLLSVALKKSQSNESRLNKKLKIVELLNAVELKVSDPFTVEWIVRNAIESRVGEVFFSDPKVLLTGSGPWDLSVFKSILKLANRKATLRKDKQVAIIVAGHDDADFQLVEDMINVRDGQPVKIFTQELFIAAILAHQDPFEELSSYPNPEEGDPDLYDMVCRFGRGHPVIEYLQNQQFPWPDSNTIEDGTLNGEWAQVDQTPLVQMNYHVGELGLKMGLMERDRRDILESAYLGDIPWVESDEYMDTWGQAGTRQRLARIAYHLSMLIRSRKNNQNQIAARNNWQKDLDWLHGFYKPLMRFRWPS